MAETTLLHLLNLHDDEDDDDVEEVDFSRHHLHPHHHRYWSSDFDNFASDLSSDFQPSDLLPRGRISTVHRPSSLLIDSPDDIVSDPESVVTSADLFDRENQVNFVMDLLHQRVEQSQLSSTATHVVVDPGFSDADPGFDPNFGSIEENDEMDPTHLDLDLGSGFLGEPTSANVENSGFVAENFEGGEHFVTGLRVLDIGSESDSEVNHDVEIDFSADDDDVSESDDDPSLRLCWDSFQIEDQGEDNEDFEWEEVDEGVDEREDLSMFLDDDDVSVMAREERVDVLGNLEWEVLLNVQNLEAIPENVNEGFNELNFGEHEHDEYNDTTEYDMMFGQFVESENTIMGRPPAAKNVVKNLPLVVLSEEDLKRNKTICAVCKDEMGVGEKARQLPCNHRYHGECILPWFGIRNTCPVCRYELPTDDPDYERRKRDQRAARVN